MLHMASPFRTDNLIERFNSLNQDLDCYGAAFPDPIDSDGSLNSDEDEE